MPSSRAINLRTVDFNAAPDFADPVAEHDQAGMNFGDRPNGTACIFAPASRRQVNAQGQFVWFDSFALICGRGRYAHTEKVEGSDRGRSRHRYCTLRPSQMTRPTILISSSNSSCAEYMPLALMTRTLGGLVFGSRSRYLMT